MLKIKIIYILAAFLCFFKHTTCNFEKHLKKITNKTGIHKIRNIDFIYMINLEERPEKWERSCKQLAPFGIQPYRFPAVNGWKLNWQTINDLGVKFQPGMTGGFMATSYRERDNLEQHHEIIQNYGQTYFVHCMSRGAMGCVLSHLSILQDALNCGYETIWVMEDDIEVMSDPREISNYIDKLDQAIGKNWDILYTDRNTRSNHGEDVPAAGMARRPNFDPLDKQQYYIHNEINEHFIQIGARFGTYSMIIRKSGAKKILDFYKKYDIFFPYDLDIYLAKGIRIFTLKQNMMRSLLHAPSDNGGANYIQKRNLLNYLKR